MEEGLAGLHEAAGVAGDGVVGFLRDCAADVGGGLLKVLFDVEADALKVSGGGDSVVGWGV